MMLASSFIYLLGVFLSLSYSLQDYIGDERSMSQVTTVNSNHVLVGPPQTPKEISSFFLEKKGNFFL